MTEDALKAANGANPANQWIGPKCFITMGNHYWLNIQSDMSCDNYFPFCLLYNGGKLNAFCFGVNGMLDSKWEDNPHPTADVLAVSYMVLCCYLNNM